METKTTNVYFVCSKSLANGSCIEFREEIRPETMPMNEVEIAMSRTVDFVMNLFVLLGLIVMFSFIVRFLYVISKKD